MSATVVSTTSPGTGTTTTPTTSSALPANLEAEIQAAIAAALPPALSASTAPVPGIAGYILRVVIAHSATWLIILA